MENASPSPPNTNTCRSGRESEIPLANGSARPWMKCAPCACTKYGNRLEQPIPATVVIFSCHILRFSISLKYSASTEKSPQPGHQVGWSAASSFLVRPLRSVDGGALTTAVAADGSVTVWLIIFAGRKLFTNFVFHVFEDFPHLPGETVGLIDALDLRVAIAGTQHGAELAVTVKSLVIVFHDNHVVIAGENVFQ